MHNFLPAPLRRAARVPQARLRRGQEWARRELARRTARVRASGDSPSALAEALRDSAAALNSSLDFETVLDRILTNIGRVAPYDAADIMLVDGDTARIVRSFPPNPETASRGRQAARLKISELANLASIAATLQPIAIPDTSRYPAWVVLPETGWIRSHAAAPIRHNDELLGFLALAAAAPGFFTQEHADRLLAFADQAAIAIRNARLYETVQRHAADLERRVRERTLELEQRRAQLQAILDSMGEGVIYDEQLETKFVNRVLTELTGYQPDEIGGYLGLLRGAVNTDQEFERLTRSIHVAVETEGLWRGELRLRRKDGSEFDAALTVTPVRNRAGQIAGSVMVLRDISREKALQEQKDRFIASASHELRTPLANLKTRLYLLRRQPEKGEQHFRVLDRVTGDMAELIENLLDVSRFERGVIPLSRRPVALQDLVSDVIAVQQPEAEHKGLALEVQLPSEPLVIDADPQRMAQVITNLVHNAILYTPPGGSVRVDLIHVPPRRVVLRVADTGSGVDPEDLPHIFEPFYRAHEEVSGGTGLGLTIAREIVRLHEGEIAVESVRGHGSLFTVTLPLHDGSA